MRILRNPRSVLVGPALVLAAGMAPATAETHPARVDKALVLVESGKTDKLEKVFKSDLPRNEGKKLSSKKDALLAMLELASLHQMAGDFAESRRWFCLADATAQEIDGQAVVSGKRTGGKVKATLVSEAGKQYVGPPYERILARTLNALNHVFEGDTEGALVELRKAEIYHQQVRDRIAEKVDEASEEQAEATDPDAFQDKFGRLYGAVADLRNSYENALTYYLTALLNFAEGDPHSMNDAWIAIEKARELSPRHPAVNALHRYVATEQFRNEPTRLAELGAVPAADAIRAGVTVIYLAGQAPRKSEVQIPLAVGTTFQTAAVSTYDGFADAPSSLFVASRGERRAAETLVQIDRLAMKAHTEQLPGMLTRAAIRMAAKGSAQQQIGKQFGGLAKLVGSLVTNLTENADLRAWYAIPAEIQVATLELPTGKSRVELAVDAMVASTELSLDAGESRLVLVRPFDGQLRVWTARLSPSNDVAMVRR